MDDKLHGRMDSCLTVEVGADRGSNERRLLPFIGAVWARETMLASKGATTTVTTIGGAFGAEQTVFVKSQPTTAGGGDRNGGGARIFGLGWCIGFRVVLD
ncbi:hypothetical protein V6N13_064090 [Hibiscus sabdariffa]